jgi:hypothetical protein
MFSRRWILYLSLLTRKLEGFLQCLYCHLNTSNIKHHQTTVHGYWRLQGSRCAPESHQNLMPHRTVVIKFQPVFAEVASSLTLALVGRAPRSMAGGLQQLGYLNTNYHQLPQAITRTDHLNLACRGCLPQGRSQFGVSPMATVVWKPNYNYWN